MVWKFKIKEGKFKDRVIFDYNVIYNVKERKQEERGLKVLKKHLIALAFDTHELVKPEFKPKELAASGALVGTECVGVIELKAQKDGVPRNNIIALSIPDNDAPF